MPTTQIVTALEVDAPLELLPNYVLSGPDRRYIDSQIRGTEQHLVELLIRGTHGSYFELDTSSDAVAAGDWGCLSGGGLGGYGLPKLTKALTTPMGNAGIVAGMFLQSAAPGSVVRIALSGVVPPSLTGLEVGDPGFVRLNPGTGRAEKVASLESGDFPLGFVDAAGYLTIVRQSPGTGGGGGGSSSGAAGLVQYSNGVGGFSAESALAYDATNNALSVGRLVLTGALEAINISGTINDQALNALTLRIEFNNTTGVNQDVTGLQGLAAGRIVSIGVTEGSTGTVSFKHQSTGSSAGNRFRFGADMVLNPGDRALIQGDASLGTGTNARWELFSGRLTAGSGSGAVDSVFGRTGAVVAAADDYNASQIDNDSAVAGDFVDDALNTLAAAIISHTHTVSQITDLDYPVDSVFGRTGAVVAATSDYDASQVDNDSAVAGATVAAALNTLNTALSGLVPTSRTLSAGAGLTGGGSLAANRTFDIGGSASITVNANDIAVNPAGVDHNSLANLTTGDAHPMYSLIDGTRAFTGPVTGVAPTLPLHLVTKAYVDAARAGLDLKDSVTALRDTNLATRSGLAQTADGVSLNTIGMRVLLTNQNTATQNGPWVVQSGAWTRPDDFLAGSTAAGAFTFVEQGTNYADTGWVCTTNTGSDVVDTNNLAWTQFSGAGQVIPGAGLTKSGNTLNVGGSASIAANADTLDVIPGGVDHNSLANLTTGDAHPMYMHAEAGIVDNRMCRWDGTGGRDIQMSAATESDTGDVTGWTSCTLGRTRVTNKSEWYETGADLNEKLWDAIPTGDILTRRTRTDADGTGATFEQIERQGTAVSRIQHITQYGLAETADSYSVEIDTADTPAASSIYRDKAGAALALTAGFRYVFEVTVDNHVAGVGYESGVYRVTVIRPAVGNVALVGTPRADGDGTTTGLDMQFVANTGTSQITCQPTVSGEAPHRKVRWSSRLVSRSTIVTVDT